MTNGFPYAWGLSTWLAKSIEEAFSLGLPRSLVAQAVLRLILTANFTIKQASE